MLYIGIDFSISSPAYAIYSQEEGDFIKWGSLTRSDRNRESYLKNKNKPYYYLASNTELFDLDFIPREIIPKDYSERERIKTQYFINIVEVFWENLLRNIPEGQEIKIAMEGLSFGSRGDVLIDISMATSLLRERIIDKIGYENFYVFSPMGIKKFAKKGNAKKYELYESLCKYKLIQGNKFKSFNKALLDNKNEWITKSKNVNKPLDDIIDATWISIFLQENIKK